MKAAGGGGCEQNLKENSLGGLLACPCTGVFGHMCVAHAHACDGEPYGSYNICLLETAGRFCPQKIFLAVNLK